MKAAPKLVDVLVPQMEGLSKEEIARAIQVHDADVEAAHKGSDICLLCVMRKMQDVKKRTAFDDKEPDWPSSLSDPGLKL